MTTKEELQDKFQEIIDEREKKWQLDEPLDQFHTIESMKSAAALMLDMAAERTLRGSEEEKEILKLKELL